MVSSSPVCEDNGYEKFFRYLLRAVLEIETSLKLVEYEQSQLDSSPRGTVTVVGFGREPEREVSEESGAVHHIVLLRVCNHIKKFSILYDILVLTLCTNTRAEST